MIELNDAQIQYIETRLAEVKIRRRDLEEELLDHLCCFVEALMADGQPFHHAVSHAFDTFQKDEMQEIQAQFISIHTKKRFMMKVSLLVLALLLVFSGFWWNRKAEEPPLVIPTALVTPVLQIKPPSISPLGGSFTITSGFGLRVHPIFQKKQRHNGVDFKAPKGTPVLATAGGTVETAVYDEKYGNYIVLRHDSLYQTMYAHLSELFVEAGQTVAHGDTIGTVGSTGASTAPHLHYEVIRNGEHEDPEKYISK